MVLGLPYLRFLQMSGNLWLPTFMGVGQLKIDKSFCVHGWDVLIVSFSEIL